MLCGEGGFGVGPDIQTLFTIAGIGIIVGMFHSVLKMVGREDWAYWLSLIGFVIVLYMIVNYIQNLFQHIQRVFHFF